MLQQTLLVILAVLLVRTAYSLRCFKCNQRLQNVTVCRNATIEDCESVFPRVESVCLKTVQQFSTGQPPWVFGQCQIRDAFQPEQLGVCRSGQTQSGTNTTDALETCTCLSDLCNRADSLARVSLSLLFGLGLGIGMVGWVL